MSKVGKSEIRVDAFDKVTGRTNTMRIVCRPVRSMRASSIPPSRTDSSNRRQVRGGGHPRRCEGADLLRRAGALLPDGGPSLVDGPGHQDVADRNLLNRHVRYYGDDVAVVIAEDEVVRHAGRARAEGRI